MRAFIKTAVIGLFFVVGCGSNDNPTSSQTVNAVGTWKVTQSGSTMTVVVNANDSFSMNLSGMSTMSGTYTLNVNKIIFTYTYCTLLGTAIQCSSPDSGTISGDQLVMPNGDGTSTTLARQ
jgi:uncharacterized membrane protein